MDKGLPQAVQATHEALLWLIPQLDKSPRNRRTPFGEKMESGLRYGCRSIAAIVF